MSEDYPMMKGRHAELNFRSYHHGILQLPPLPLDFATSCTVIPLHSFSLLTSTLLAFSFVLS